TTPGTRYPHRSVLDTALPVLNSVARQLQSQFDTLEPLEEDETGRVFDVTRPAEEIAEDAAAWIKTGA
ncbi:hypothetical protein ABRP88_06650, partial [Corynebacterium sp. KPL2734]